MIYVIRHGQVDTNVEKLINGWNEEHLNKQGINEAIEAGNILKKIKLDKIYCSPLIRTKETLKYLNIKNVSVFFDDRLKERNSKSLVRKPVSSIDKKIWYDNNKIIAYSDSEGFKSIINRVNEFLKEIELKDNKKNILIITHGDICKAIHLYFNPKEEIYNFRQGNCEILKYSNYK